MSSFEFSIKAHPEPALGRREFFGKEPQEVWQGSEEARQGSWRASKAGVNEGIIPEATCSWGMSEKLCGAILRVEIGEFTWEGD